ncbi:uncharacterized protein LOC116852589 [Odontomachus brunneus]|uniref:uncharacterized protein LOC116852589 n=1 Tax=Odontomachus brunneus TaxID=486640 RepID=UPI0013F28535|nr:uncharacterized protein LOC116852589 [Odontomachus brunneus]
MTRKCVLCKETNYKNNYSFFSAPKDPEIRKKWQIALGIENYTITDDIYVCSRHFNKNDIITHWVSGVPPQVIKIKYKKCRLRPGAVPGKYYSGNSSQSIDKDALNKSEMDMNDFLIFRRKEDVDSLKDEKTFLISKRKKNLNEYINRNTNVCYRIYPKLQDCTHNVNENFECNNIQLSEDMDKVDINISIQTLEPMESKSKRRRSESNKMLEYGDNYSLNVFVEPNTEPMDTNREESQLLNKQSHADIFSETAESIKKYDFLKEDRMPLEIWKRNVTSADSEKSVNSNLKITDDSYMNNQVLAALNYDNLSTQSKIVYDISKNEILFEDFLEVCTEVSIPRGWSCLVTSKGHNTTVVYLCMGITKNGLPFMEKQVFIRSDMLLHCAVANREIDPFVHNLVKDKHIKIKSLLDIEELVDEFDQRVVCQGIHDEKIYEDINITKVAYKDGTKWRHTLCSLIVNNNLSRCIKCALLLRTLVRKSSQIYETKANKYITNTKTYRRVKPSI